MAREPLDVSAFDVSLRREPQWGVVGIGEEGKPKPFCARTGVAASPRVPATWSTFSEAEEAFNSDERWAGVCYFFKKGDPHKGSVIWQGSEGTILSAPKGFGAAISHGGYLTRKGAKISTGTNDSGARHEKGLSAHSTLFAHLSKPSTWPSSLEEEAFHGIAGVVVRAIAPETEADPSVLLTNFLACFGNAIGRTAYASVGKTRHHTNLFVVHVGPSGEGRKGTGLDVITDLFERIDEEWARNRINKGSLSSGEGLIHEVRDPAERKVAVKSSRTKTPTGEYETVVDDEGVRDKRLLAAQTELGGVLKVMGREGSTLSAVLRQAWDSGNMGMLVKTAPGRVRGAHISIVGHITPQELLRNLTDTEAANGFANRFLWICCRRSKYLPEGGDVPELPQIVLQLRGLLEHGRALSKMKRDRDAIAIWAAVYPQLSKRPLGMLGAITSRAEAQVLRLSTIYAILDGDTAIRACHVLAALAVWDYAERSAAFVFGCSTGDEVSDKILDALLAPDAEDGRTLSELRDIFSRHITANQMAQALRTLLDAELVRCETRQGKGRPAEVWFAQPGAFASSGSMIVSPALVRARKMVV